MFIKEVSSNHQASIFFDPMYSKNRNILKYFYFTI